MEIASVQWGLFFTFRLFSLIRPGLRPVHLPRRGRLPPAGEHSSGPGLNFQGSPPHPALRGHPLQAGEGGDSLRRGRSLTFPWGKMPPQRRMRGRLPCVKGAVSPRLTEGSSCCRLCTAPHPSGPLALPPSPRRGYEKPPPGGRLPPRGRWHAVRRDG